MPCVSLRKIVEVAQRKNQLQMSVDKSWGAGLSLSAARIQHGMQGRDAEENRAAVPTPVYGHLELTTSIS
ncbi:hypothetical protein Y032_0008g301 [Ancylostoma ceylanicum]|uniref:Uncharacterized protein n=1 Tax=Ancylostoma ceylanicum TaxID=53326 RepID=A0A016VLA1_9BILA|nr:hypothetical protein Y032_0008g301 [Ancylostoma ceylanicum]